MILREESIRDFASFVSLDTHQGRPCPRLSLIMVGDGNDGAIL